MRSAEGPDRKVDRPALAEAHAGLLQPLEQLPVGLFARARMRDVAVVMADEAL